MPTYRAFLLDHENTCTSAASSTNDLSAGGSTTVPKGI